MLEKDVAQLYQTSAKELKEAVRSNKLRFPPDFMFELTREEQRFFKSQIASSKPEGRSGGVRNAPMAFTDLGILMLAGLLKTDQAMAVSIQLIRSFTQLRNAAAINKALYREVEILEEKVKKPDKKCRQLFKLLKDLLQPVDVSQPPVFRAGKTVKTK